MLARLFFMKIFINFIYRVYTYFSGHNIYLCVCVCAYEYIWQKKTTDSSNLSFVLHVLLAHILVHTHKQINVKKKLLLSIAYSRYSLSSGLCLFFSVITFVNSYHLFVGTNKFSIIGSHLTQAVSTFNALLFHFSSQCINHLNSFLADHSVQSVRLASVCCSISVEDMLGIQVG